MSRLSCPIEQLQDHYAVVIVGSGYGGAIAAARLARAGRRVAVVERGREWQPGEYPSTEYAVLREMQASITEGADGPDAPSAVDAPLGPGRPAGPDRRERSSRLGNDEAATRHVGSEIGLYEFNLGPHLNVFKGCGLGGTSLVNAGVALRADPRVFSDPRWPQELRRDVDGLLEEGYRRAEAMLKPTPYPDHHAAPPKLVALEKSARFLRVAARRPPINVNFSLDGPNHVGVVQHPCSNCGDCVTGCNYAAKNTLIMNYLPEARAAGAEIFTGIAVRWIEKPGFGARDSGFEKPGVGIRGSGFGKAGVRGSGFGSRQGRVLREAADSCPPISEPRVHGFSENSSFPNPEPRIPSPGSSWLVHCQLLGLGREKFDAPEITIGADLVILAAGALGSTEILLRSRQRGLALSAHVGERLTSNGDMLGFAYASADEVNGVGWGDHKPGEIPPVGPCITGMIDLRDAASLDEGLVIEEGSPPGALARFLPETLAAVAETEDVAPPSRRLESRQDAGATTLELAETEDVAPPSRRLESRQDVGATTLELAETEDVAPPSRRLESRQDAGATTLELAETEDVAPPSRRLESRQDAGATTLELCATDFFQGPYQGAVRNTQTFLAMGHDDGAGRMMLENDLLRIHWPGVGNQPVFQRIRDRLGAAARALEGLLVMNPLWTKLLRHNLLTVHPLGGCVMAEQAEQGVVNHKGQVFSGPRGAAVYEDLYICDGAIIPRPLGVNPLLTISALAERCCALMIGDRGPVAPPSRRLESRQDAGATRPLGLAFTETMRGYFSRHSDNFWSGAKLGRLERSPFTFTLTIVTEDLDAMLASPAHEARIIGSVTAPALSPRPLTATEGVFNLFVTDPTSPSTRRMEYHMKLTADDGRVYGFEGFKVIRYGRARYLWRDTTTLYITLRDGAAKAHGQESADRGYPLGDSAISRSAGLQAGMVDSTTSPLRDGAAKAHGQESADRGYPLGDSAISRSAGLQAGMVDSTTCPLRDGAAKAHGQESADRGYPLGDSAISRSAGLQAGMVDSTTCPLRDDAAKAHGQESADRGYPLGDSAISRSAGLQAGMVDSTTCPLRDGAAKAHGQESADRGYPLGDSAISRSAGLQAGMVDSTTCPLRDDDAKAHGQESADRGYPLGDSAISRSAGLQAGMVDSTTCPLRDGAAKAHGQESADRGYPLGDSAISRSAGLQAGMVDSTTCPPEAGTVNPATCPPKGGRYDGPNRVSAVIGKGILKISPADLLRQLSTFEVKNAPHLAERLEAEMRFGRFFAGALYKTYTERPR